MHVNNGNFLRIVFFAIAIWFFPLIVNADNFVSGSKYQTCFTPEQDCTSMINSMIAQAKESILLWTFTLTSKPIAEALVNAKRRGVEVKVLLDARQFDNLIWEKRLVRNVLVKNHIPVWLDYKMKTSHDKTIIVDKCIVETGSFNYTSGAQFRNSENLMIIHDRGLAEKYKQHWDNRIKESKRLYVRKDKKKKY